MNKCPQCHSVYTDDYVYCLHDGTLLAAEEGEQETLVRHRVNMPSPSGPIAACGACGHDNRLGSKFCKTCGGLIIGQRGSLGSSAFSFAASAAAPALEPQIFQETVSVSPAIFSPPHGSKTLEPQSAPNRLLLYLAGGMGGLVLVLIAAAALMSGSSRQTANGMDKTPTPSATVSILPTTFDRNYSGNVYGRRTFSLSMTLKRDKNVLTGTANTEGNMDELNGTIDESGDFELEGHENGVRHTGYWSGQISVDGAVNGHWTDLNRNRRTPFSMHENK